MGLFNLKKSKNKEDDFEASDAWLMGLAGDDEYDNDGDSSIHAGLASLAPLDDDLDAEERLQAGAVEGHATSARPRAASARPRAASTRPRAATAEPPDDGAGSARRRRRRPVELAFPRSRRRTPIERRDDAAARPGSGSARLGSGRRDHPVR
ncbi:MAG: hypothetical protein R2710_11310 [Acidimicrobiales bacterium]